MIEFMFEDLEMHLNGGYEFHMHQSIIDFKSLFIDFAVKCWD